MKKQDKVIKQIVKFFSDMGQELRKVDDPISKRFEADTKYGVLRLSVWDDADSLFTRFENHEAIPKSIQVAMRMNPFNGKWNFHSKNFLEDFFSSYRTYLC